MKDRTIRILAALVQDFIESASPVPSKRLLESNDFNISSATVRNEFAILESVGLIHSPHVSAGKVPTQKGYRFFVDELLTQRETQREKHQALITSVFEKHLADYKLQKQKEFIFDAVRLAAQLSGNIAFATVDDDRTFYLGLSNVLRSPEFLHDPEKAAQIIEVLEGRDRFHDFLDGLQLPEGQVRFFIGEENILQEVSSCAIVVARFQTSYARGHLGILGPMRMQYGFNRELIQNLLRIIYWFLVDCYGLRL